MTVEAWSNFSCLLLDDEVDSRGFYMCQYTIINLRCEKRMNLMISSIQVAPNIIIDTEMINDNPDTSSFSKRRH